MLSSFKINTKRFLKGSTAKNRPCFSCQPCFLRVTSPEPMETRDPKLTNEKKMRRMNLASRTILKTNILSHSSLIFA